MLFRNAANRPAYINTFTAEFMNNKIRQLALQKKTPETFENLMLNLQNDKI